MTLPIAAQRALTARGDLDERGATRRPRPGHCTRCRLALTVAITNYGFTETAWPIPTTLWGEFDAQMRGLRTFTIDNHEMRERPADVIASVNADQARVLVQHRCGDPAPEANPLHVQLGRPEYLEPPF